MKRECPGCSVDLTGTHGNRIWCSEKCRKSIMYGGTCETCGATTDGSNGREMAPRYCKDCAPEAYTFWTRELIVEKIRKWADLYGRPPSAMDWDPSRIQRHPTLSTRLKQRKSTRFHAHQWPYHSYVQKSFGTWAAGLKAAGFESNPVGRAGRWETAA